MKRTHAIVVATRDERTRKDFARWFSSPQLWHCIFASDGSEALSAVLAHMDALALFVLDASIADGQAQQALRAVTDAKRLSAALVPRGKSAAAYLPPDVTVSAVLETPLDPKQTRCRLHRLISPYCRYDPPGPPPRITRDTLLEMPDQRCFPAVMEECLATNADTMGVCACIHMDNMRALNEQAGHQFGDLVLVDAANAILQTLPHAAVVGRPHGDSFIAYVPGMSGKMEIIHLMESLKLRLRRTYTSAPGVSRHITATIGAAIYPDHADSTVALLTQAEKACGVARGMGNDLLLFYAQTMQDAAAISMLAATQTDDTPAGEYFLPVLGGTSDVVIGYDYLTAPPEVVHNPQTTRAMLALPFTTRLHHLRTCIRQFFARLPRLIDAKGLLPKFSVYAPLHEDQADIFPQLLQEALAEYAIETRLVCINIPQQTAVAMSHAHLEALSRAIHALGFSFGVYSVGDATLANVCFVEDLFDRILFAPSFVSDILYDTFPPAFIEQTIKYLAQNGIVLCFPAALSEANKRFLAQFLGENFSSYQRTLNGESEFLAHRSTQKNKMPPDRIWRDVLSFQMGNDRFSELLARSGIIIFDWRPHDDSVAVSGSFEALYGRLDPNTKLQTLVQTLLHPDDVPRATEQLLMVKHDNGNSEGIFRVRRSKHGETDYHWRRFFVINAPQPAGMVSHVYCISFDVDRERREMQDILHRAETDPLTQVYNRGATEAHIRHFLENEGAGGQHALFIVDLDDFKQINDRFGHQEGDKALQHLAHQMQHLFRERDIIGRLGGDEFIVFLKNIRSVKKIESRAQDIGESIKSPALWNLSVTVGIARYPMHGESFDMLYARADSALYQAKQQGKKRWTFYDPDKDTVENTGK